MCVILIVSSDLLYSFNYNFLFLISVMAPVYIGSNPVGEERYQGLMQDLRLYSSSLNHTMISELYDQPARHDLRVISGYLVYQQAETEKTIQVEVLDDQEAEGEELFYLQLISAHGGANLPMPHPTAILRVQKSDNANGRFGFSGNCMPEVSKACIYQITIFHLKLVIYCRILFYINLLHQLQNMDQNIGMLAQCLTGTNDCPV